MSPPPPRVLEPLQMLVVNPGGARALEPLEAAAPAAITPGLNGGAVDGVVAAEGSALWFIRWADDAELAVAVEAGETPDFAALRQALEHARSRRLETMPVANRLPA